MHSGQVDSATTDTTVALFEQNTCSKIFLIVEFNILQALHFILGYCLGCNELP